MYSFMWTVFVVPPLIWSNKFQFLTFRTAWVELNSCVDEIHTSIESRLADNIKSVVIIKTIFYSSSNVIKV